MHKKQFRNKKKLTYEKGAKPNEKSLNLTNHKSSNNEI